MLANSADMYTEMHLSIQLIWYQDFNFDTIFWKYHDIDIDIFKMISM